MTFKKSIRKKILIIRMLCSAVLLFSTVFLAGCGDPTIDASSPEKLQASLEKTMQSLPDLQQEQFRQDVVTLARGENPDPNLSIVDYITARDTPNKAKPLVLRHFYNALQGKTGKQVIAEAVRVREIQKDNAQKEKDEKKAREVERENLLAEINAIKERQRQATRNEIQLRSIKVWRTSFSYVERLGSDENELVMKPMIQIAVYNGTDYTFNKIYFEGSLLLPDDKRPIHKESFEHTIPQGFSSGEQATWTIHPDAASGWNNIEIPDGAFLSVEVTRIDNANNQEILPGVTFSQEDRIKLEQLRKKYREQFGPI